MRKSWPSFSSSDMRARSALTVARMRYSRLLRMALDCARGSIVGAAVALDVPAPRERVAVVDAPDEQAAISRQSRESARGSAVVKGRYARPRLYVSPTLVCHMRALHLIVRPPPRASP